MRKPFTNPATLTADLGGTACELAALRARVADLRRWVDDLQSGMYVNCVYCGHRYGPGETTPVSMADALKAHVERCPEHPMSALRARVEFWEAQAKDVARVNLELRDELERELDIAARHAVLQGEAITKLQAEVLRLREELNEQRGHMRGEP